MLYVPCDNSLLAVPILMQFLKYFMHPFSVLQKVIRIMCR